MMRHVRFLGSVYQWHHLSVLQKCREMPIKFQFWPLDGVSKKKADCGPDKHTHEAPPMSTKRISTVAKNCILDSSNSFSKTTLGGALRHP
jgi:hypothetical protein